METVKHLWNVNQFMMKLKCPLVTDLRIFYMQKCKNFSNSVELPQQNFGPLVMCSHCGSLWNMMDNQVRIAKGKKMSKTIKKIVRYINENPGQKIPKVRATLVQKCIKNEMNRLVIKCSVCSENTELPFKKNRLKPVRLNNSQTETPQSKRKRKKKKSKDKTAGLNISGCTPVSQLNKEDNNKRLTISPTIISNIILTKNNKSNEKSISPKKPKKLNIERLKHIMQNKTPSKRNNLHNFLAELY